MSDSPAPPRRSQREKKQVKPLFCLLYCPFVPSVSAVVWGTELGNNAGCGFTHIVITQPATSTPSASQQQRKRKRNERDSDDEPQDEAGHETPVVTPAKRGRGRPPAQGKGKKKADQDKTGDDDIEEDGEDKEKEAEEDGAPEAEEDEEGDQQEDEDDEDSGDDGDDDDEEEYNAKPKPKVTGKGRGGRRKSSATPKAKGRPPTKRPRTAKQTDATASTSGVTHKVPKPHAKRGRKPKEPTAEEVHDAEQAAKENNIQMDNPLFNSLLNPTAALQQTAEDFLESLDQTPGPALAELVNLVLRCCGCNDSVNGDEAVDYDGVVDALDNFTEALKQEDSPIYPLTSKLPLFKRFRKSLSELLDRLIASSAALGHLYTSDLMPTLQAWVIAMSSSHIRSFRHTATVVALEVETALCEVANEVEKEAEIVARQREGEKKRKATAKGAATGSTARLKELEIKAKEIRDKKKKLAEYIKEFVDGVFVHRYRDLDPNIRAECVRSIGLWFRKHPSHFLDASYLRYVGWVLSDSTTVVRLEAVKSLLPVYCPPSNSPNSPTSSSAAAYIGSFSTFTERFKSRMIEMAKGDTELSVRVAVLQVLKGLDTYSLLEPEEREGICMLIFDGEAKVRKAVGAFVKAIWEEEIEERLAISEENMADESERDGDGTGRKKLSKEERKKRVGAKALAELLVRWGKKLDQMLGEQSSDFGSEAGGDAMDVDEDDGQEDGQRRRTKTGGNTRRGLGMSGSTSPTQEVAAALVEADLRGRIALVVEALWDEVEAVSDWQGLLAVLLLDHSARGGDEDDEGVNGATTSARGRGGAGGRKGARVNGKNRVRSTRNSDDIEEAWRLEEIEESVLLEVLVAALRRAKSEAANSKKGEDEEVNGDITRALIEALPRLFIKHQSDQNRIVVVLMMPTLMNLDLYVEMRMLSAYASLWDDITKQFLSHSSLTVLRHAITAIRYLLDATSLANTNSTKMAELEDELASTLRTAALREDSMGQEVDEEANANAADHDDEDRQMNGQNEEEDENIESPLHSKKRATKAAVLAKQNKNKATAKNKGKSSKKSQQKEVDIELARYSEDEMISIGAICTRLAVLAGAKDLTSWMEDDDSGKERSVWDIVLALVERGKLGDKVEQTMVEQSLHLLTLHILWKGRKMTTSANPSPEEKKLRESLVTQRGQLLEKLEEYAIGRQSNTLPDVKRTAFKHFIDLHVLFAPSPTTEPLVPEPISAPTPGTNLEGDEPQMSATPAPAAVPTPAQPGLPTAAVSIKLTDKQQADCAGYIDAEIEIYASELGWEDGASGDGKQDANGDVSSGDEGEDEDEEDAPPQGKAGGSKKKKATGTKLKEVDIHSRAHLEREYLFIDVVSTFLRAIRANAIQVQYGAKILAHYGRLGPAFDACAKVIVDVLREEGMFNDNGEAVVNVVTDAMQEAYHVEVGNGAACTQLAKLLSSSFLVRGSQLSIVRKLNVKYIIEIQIKLLNWVTTEIASAQRKGKDQLKNAIALFKAIIPLLSTVQSKDAQQIKSVLDAALARAKLEPSPAAKAWEPYRAYEKRLATLLGKEKPVATKGRKGKGAKSAAAITTDDEEEHEVERMIESPDPNTSHPVRRSARGKPPTTPRPRDKGKGVLEDGMVTTDHEEEQTTPKAPKPRGRPRKNLITPSQREKSPLGHSSTQESLDRQGHHTPISRSPAVSPPLSSPPPTDDEGDENKENRNELLHQDEVNGVATPKATRKRARPVDEDMDVEDGPNQQHSDPNRMSEGPDPSTPEAPPTPANDIQIRRKRIRH